MKSSSKTNQKAKPKAKQKPTKKNVAKSVKFPKWDTVLPTSPSSHLTALVEWAMIKTTPIVPNKTVVGRTLTLVTAVMAFLACLAFGGAWAVHHAANKWTQEVSQEMTVQIKPIEGVDIELETEKALEILLQTEGVTDATLFNERDTNDLLQPWLGSGLDLSLLPVPRLIAVQIDTSNPPSTEDLTLALTRDVKGVSLDNHQTWQQQIRSFANLLKLAGFATFMLMLGATMMIVIFATRSAMASNKTIVEVLHQVGAEETFIAREFSQHFLILGLKGGFIGGIIAVLTFAIMEFFAQRIIASNSNEESGSNLVNALSLGWQGHGSILIVVFLIAALTALTSRWAVHYFLRNYE